MQYHLSVRQNGGQHPRCPLTDDGVWTAQGGMKGRWKSPEDEVKAVNRR